MYNCKNRVACLNEWMIYALCMYEYWIIYEWSGMFEWMNEICEYACLYEWIYECYVCRYVCMYVCMYVGIICVYVYACLNVWLYVFMYKCMYVCMYDNTSYCFASSIIELKCSATDMY